MAQSGYTKKVRAEVVKAGLLTYARKVRSQRVGISQINRPRCAARDNQRYLAKLVAPTSWFKQQTKLPERELAGIPRELSTELTQRLVGNWKRAGKWSQGTGAAARKPE